MYDSKRSGHNDNERPTDYSKDPKFNKKAAIAQEFDFYAKATKQRGIDETLERGDLARKRRGH